MPGTAGLLSNRTICLLGLPASVFIMAVGLVKVRGAARGSIFYMATKTKKSLETLMGFSYVVVLRLAAWDGALGGRR